MSNRSLKPPAKQQTLHRPNNLKREQQAHRALLESEEMHRTLTEQSLLGIIVLQGFRIVFANAAFAEISGYSVEEVLSLPPEKVQALVHSEDQALVWGRFRDRLAGKAVPPRYEYRGIRKDGTVCWLEMHSSRTEYGGKPAIQGNIIDISERKQTGEALKDREAFLNGIISAFRETMLVVYDRDARHVNLWADPELEKRYGIQATALLGESPSSFLLPPEASEKIAQVKRVFETGEHLHLEFPVRFPGGDFWHDAIISPIQLPSGEITAVMALIRDITERKRSEETLRQSEERYRTLFEQSNDPIYIVTREGILIDVNQSMCQLFGYSREEMEGMDIRKLYVNPTERADFQKTIEKGGVVKDYELRLRKKDGTELECLITSTVRQGEDGISGYQGTMRDVTERRQMEDALRQSEAKFRSLVQGASVGIATSDTEGIFTFANPAIYRIYGYTEEDVLGKPILNFVHPDDKERVIDFFRTLRGNHTDLLGVEFKTLRKDGNTIYLHVSPTHIRHEGQTTGFIASMIDITERKRAEETLRQSEERYRTILDEMEDNYYEVDLAGNFTFVNEATCRTLGYTRDELIGINNRMYVAEEDAKAMFQDFHKVYLTGKPTKGLAYKVVRRDGTTGIGELAVYPLRNEKGEIIGFRGIGRDITERKQMEEALETAAEQWKTTFDAMNDAVYLLDNECRIVRCNRALEKLLGKPSNEIIGGTCWEVVHRTPGPIEDCPMLRMKQTLQRETTLRSVGNKHLELTADPVMDKNGNLVGAVHIIADISQRKQAEEERQQMEQKAQLASRLASVGELAAGIAHEINNPLTSVIGYAQLLSGEENVPADMKKDLKAIIDGANRVAGIVKRLLTFARQAKPQQTLVNTADLITATLDLRAYHLRNNNIKVTTQFDPKLPIITADAGQLQQVFLNIIVNAETEMKQSRGKGKLLIKTEKVGKNIRVSFEDNGPGIAKENLDRIFHPFFTTKDVGEGTGLGLSICYGIIAEHNGKIWAESQTGKGATFIVELPIVTKSSQVKQAKPPEEKTPKVAKAKILAVDDEPMILQLVSRILAEEGYQVETAGSAASALKMIDTRRYSLILLDIKMPDMDGIQLYKCLQKMAPSLAKRVMFITGDVMGPETEAFLSRTKAPYATKPFDSGQLKREIERLLARGQ